ncbi:hypothetical protein DRJ17_01275 [Candidatus Woesearchaeota archaeon]|nr:MAG: hypothetical protein DRJ17_01275 [Candidatus Woesearchaeota archaeon]
MSVYLKRELIKYIKEELDRGVKLSKIQEALLKGGHNRNLIDEVIYDLKKHNFDIVKALREPLRLNPEAEELYFDIVESLVRYIEQQLEQGSTITEVKETLLDFGHAEETINKAIDRVLAAKEKASRRIKLSSVALSAIILFAIMFTFSAITLEPFSLVVIAFFPSILMLAVGAFFRGEKNLLLVMPFLLAIIFFLLGSKVGVIANMEVGPLTFYNLVFSLVIAAVIYDKTKKRKRQLKLRWSKKEQAFTPKLVKL